MQLTPYMYYYNILLVLDRSKFSTVGSYSYGLLYGILADGVDVIEAMGEISIKRVDFWRAFGSL
eukprot:COSAG02_NODE_3244_length_7106_cov_5.600400_5_plen_64_part_00